MINVTLYELSKTTIIKKLTAAQLKCLQDSLTQEQKLNLSSVLPLDIPLKLVLVLNLDEEYWRKKCFENSWTHVHYWLSDRDWKKTFLACHAENVIEDFILQKTPLPEVENSLLILKDCLRSLKINGYKFNYANIKTESFDPVDTKEHIERNILKLVSSFKNLEEIHFYNFPIDLELFVETNDDIRNSTNELSEIFQEMKSLLKFSLVGTPSKSIDFPKLINTMISFDTLIYLNLSCNQITDDNCEHISKLLEQSRIQSLALSNNFITNKGAEQIATVLKENEYIFELKMNKNLIADKGAISIMQSLMSNTRLLKLDLAHNKIDSQCSLVICDLLGENKTLQSLNVTANPLGKETGKLLRDAIRRNTNLLTFEFQFCGFDVEDQDSIQMHLLENYQAHVQLCKLSPIKTADECIN
ncbi:hypothetical protein JTE90_015267 [Oedothorax gibbosus]|uniref:Uncharacterized protein n=1 Tax=Oedothorax gibbosus TaxID=931172 RepID=A0AAV6UBN1_9ARAC|nr:hypothetical protein JTE90_015267 [Oedothorax gibbosus]